MDVLFSLKSISLKYQLADESIGNNQVVALDDLCLDIYENEFLAILGANGSGKSSLAKLLAGLAGKFTGEMIYDGKTITSYCRDIFSDVALILQEPQNQILMPTVREEIAFPLENRKIAPDIIAEKTISIARQFGLTELLDKNTDQLSGGQITALALATALVTEPNVVILDEPDSHLDEQARKVLLEFIEANKGKRTVILISQYPNSAKNADRCLVLSEGRSLVCGAPLDILADRAILEKSRLIARNDATKTPVFQKDKTRKFDRQAPVISLNDVAFSYDKKIQVLENINLEIFRGERIGLVGPSGSGKTTLGLLMAGLLKPDRGKILLENTPIEKIPAKQLRKQITMAMQFPERALIGHTVAEDIAFGPRNLGYNDIESIIEKNLEQFQLNHLRDRHPFTLSGGQKRRAALAGVMAMDTSIIILDEPTAALDPQTTADFMAWLKGERKYTMVIIGHDLDMISLLCDRVITLNKGLICNEKD
jgi:energy-coupling factor transport system ATP-binding protein